MYLNDNNKMKYIQRKGRWEETAWRDRERLREYIYIFIFLTFISFSNLRKSDRRFSLGLKEKLIYAMRAMRGHQNLGVSLNSMR